MSASGVVDASQMTVEFDENKNSSLGRFTDGGIVKGDQPLQGVAKFFGLGGTRLDSLPTIRKFAFFDFGRNRILGKQPCLFGIDLDFVAVGAAARMS